MVASCGLRACHPVLHCRKNSAGEINSRQGVGQKCSTHRKSPLVTVRHAKKQFRPYFINRSAHRTCHQSLWLRTILSSGMRVAIRIVSYRRSCFCQANLCVIMVLSHKSCLFYILLSSSGFSPHLNFPTQYKQHVKLAT